ncbi:MAG: hypothetical protein MUE52_13645 [Tabrizicola sp.]|nr:hypothetical protein [Tabrizicola sp.]
MESTGLRFRCGKPERATRRLFFGLIAVLFFAIPAVPAAADTCGLKKDAAPESVIRAIQKIQDGDYTAFVSAIEHEGSEPQESSLSLASDLESYAGDGFQDCVIIMEDIRANSHSLLLFFSDGNDNERIIYVFFMLARIEGEWMFLKTQVSTSFDEVYQYVR